jgi:hypothetical protein
MMNSRSEKLLSSLPPVNKNLPKFRGRLQNPKQALEQLEMASESLTMNSGLIAIALVIRSGVGPRFVYHYPPHPTEQASQRETRFGTELDISDEGDDDDEPGDSDDSDLEDGGFQLNQTFGKFNLGGKISKKRQHHVDLLEADDHYDSPSGEHIVPWEHLGEFSTTDLEMILTPSRAFHKKKFELSLDPLHFVSYPMHIREDGLWKKRKLKSSKKSKKESSEAGSSEGKSAENEKKEECPKDKQADSDDHDDHGEMTMFNVVFVLNVPKDEADERILDMYEHVIKKFNKALKHAQAQSNYVWKESELILAMKEKARDERKLRKASAQLIY